MVAKILNKDCGSGNIKKKKKKPDLEDTCEIEVTICGELTGEWLV